MDSTYQGSGRKDKPDVLASEESNSSKETKYIDTEDYKFEEREVKAKSNDELKIDSFFKNYQRLTIDNEVGSTEI